MCRTLGFLGLAAAALLAACAGQLRNSDALLVRVADEQLLPEMQARLTSIQPGISDRTAVLTALGEPWLTSTLWSVDVFRIKASAFNPGLVWIYYPIPVPAWDSLYGFVLVVYGVDGLVAGVDSGILWPDDSEFPESLSTRLRTAIVATGVQLSHQAGGLLLTANGPHREAALATSSTNGQCLTVVGSTDGYGLDALTVRHLKLDGRTPPFLDYRLDESQDQWLLRVSRLAAGTHQFAIVGNDYLEPVNFQFDCRADAVLYVNFEFVPGSTPGPRVTKRERLTVTVTSAIDPELASRALLLARDGIWLAPH